MTQIRIDIQDAELETLLARLVEGGEDLRPLMDDLAARLLQSTRRRFETASSPEGQAWPPLSRSTLRARGPNAKPLRKSGRLYQSIHARTDERSLVVGTNVVYAAIHQLGGEIQRFARSQVQNVGKSGRFARKGRTKTTRRITIGEHSVTIPARPFLGASDRDRHDIASGMRAYLARIADQAAGEARQ